MSWILTMPRPIWITSTQNNVTTMVQIDAPISTMVTTMKHDVRIRCCTTLLLLCRVTQSILLISKLCRCNINVIYDRYSLQVGLQVTASCSRGQLCVAQVTGLSYFYTGLSCGGCHDCSGWLCTTFTRQHQMLADLINLNTVWVDKYRLVNDWLFLCGASLPSMDYVRFLHIENILILLLNTWLHGIAQ